MGATAQPRASDFHIQTNQIEVDFVVKLSKEDREESCTFPDNTGSWDAK
jgi:hypothetical protein